MAEAILRHERSELMRNTHGFTVVELCIAIMLVGILAAVATPELTGFLRHYRLNGAARLVWGDVQQARLMAVKESRPIRIDFTPTAYTLVRVDTAQVAFSRNLAGSYPGITLSVNTDTVLFGSAGLLSTPLRTVQIHGSTGTKSFTILPTGSIGTIS
jgi:prepilin-type N-terminal cleavage/methylation domain-containing protein